MAWNKAVRGSGEYHLELSGDDAERGVDFAPMGAPQKHFVEAEHVGGRLYITDQSDTPFWGKRFVCRHLPRTGLSDLLHEYSRQRATTSKNVPRAGRSCY
jgi:hypothetical protein